jgi:CpeT protein
MTGAIGENLLTLATWMAGDFSNYQQSFDRPSNFAHIHVLWRPLPWEFFGGVGFYSEQVYDYDLWTPYRQGIHLLVDKDDHIYIENYALQDPMLYAGAARELSILETIQPAAIARRVNCSMVFTREGEMFRGGVEPGNNCLIENNGKMTYLVSQVEITATTWQSIDMGMDLEKHEQIWGSRFGPLCFQKKEQYPLPYES